MLPSQPILIRLLFHFLANFDERPSREAFEKGDHWATKAMLPRVGEADIPEAAADVEEEISPGLRNAKQLISGEVESFSRANAPGTPNSPKYVLSMYVVWDPK